MHQDMIEQCFQMYHQDLLLYAYSLTRNIDDAKDLVSDAFVKALLSFEGNHLKPWLYVVLKNEFYTQAKRKRRLVDVDVETMSTTPPFLTNLIYEEQKQWLYQTLMTYPKKEQDVMWLSLDDELKDEDIAHILDLSVQNVRVIRHRVKQKLMKEAHHEHT